jgi:hypothetical protein
MKCLRYFPQDDMWYALDSLIQPLISPLLTDNDWQHHTAKAQIFLLLQTTHTPGPSMGAPQPSNAPVPADPDTPFDLDAPLIISRTPAEE